MRGDRESSYSAKDYAEAEKGKEIKSVMTIGGVTGTNSTMQAGHSGMNMQEDSVSKNIQNQIANAQKALQELSSNENMTLEEKMKKRQEIQKEITALNQQLRQHQMEQRKERQKGSSMDDMLGVSRKAQEAQDTGSGLSQASMQAMISADSSVKQSKVQGSMATKMEGKAGVLEVEIKLDKERGANTEKKEEELAGLEAKAQAATSSQISTLAEASETVEEAAKEDSNANNKAEATENKGEKTDKPAESESKEDGLENRVDSPANGAVSAGEAANIEVQAAASAVPQPTAYKSVDVRL